MKLLVFLMLVFVLQIHLVNAQNIAILKGAVVDSTLNKPISRANISISTIKDSIIINSSWTSLNGAFVIKLIPVGQYILTITSDEYEELSKIIIINEPTIETNLGMFKLIKRPKELDQVNIQGTAIAIKIKGDTVEYNSKAYVKQPNDKVEDLLRQLAGMNVNKEGKITAHGKVVKKILVEGEEFFGDDPTLVTKNLRADMIDKVQLFDKKSDQSVFTGIDDGSRITTINLTLKEDRKTGTFGKAEAGKGSDGLFNFQGLFNKFNKVSKFSIFATHSKIGTVGLSQDDNENTGSSVSNEIGGIDSYTGKYDGNGLPSTSTAGVHYDNKLNGGKDIFNLNYKTGSIDVIGSNDVYLQQNLPSQTIKRSTQGEFTNSAFRQKFDGAFQTKPDTSSQVKVYVEAINKTFDTNNDFLSRTMSNNSSLNTETRGYKDEGKNNIFNSNLFFAKKLGKTGRSFSLNINQKFSETQAIGLLNSAISYQNNLTGVDSVIVIDQKTDTKNKTFRIGNKLTFTEPLSKSVAVSLDYELDLRNSLNRRASFDISPIDDKLLLNDTFSNEFKFKQTANLMGAQMTFKGHKTLFNIGTRFGKVSYDQANLLSYVRYVRSFSTWMPKAKFQFNFSQMQNLVISYNGNSIQPTVDQLQPVLTNSDPLNIVSGNELLKPYLDHQIKANYLLAKMISGQSFYFGADLAFSSNTIVQNNLTESSGRTISSFINLESKTPFRYTLYGSYSTKVNPWDLFFELNVTASSAKVYSLINSSLVNLNSHYKSIRISISKEKFKSYRLGLSGGPNYTYNTFSTESNNSNKAPGFNGNFYGTLYLHDYSLTSDLDFLYNGKTNVLITQKRALWNASLNKTFLKTKNLKLSLSINDILNENSLISRISEANKIVQSNFSGIKRYYMISLIWDFTQFTTSKT